MITRALVAAGISILVLAVAASESGSATTAEMAVIRVMGTDPENTVSFYGYGANSSGQAAGHKLPLEITVPTSGYHLVIRRTRGEGALRLEVVRNGRIVGSGFSNGDVLVAGFIAGTPHIGSL